MLWENDGVPFAVDADGNFRDVADVERGLRCACFCADCKGPLLAKKGEIRAHHFAHHDRRECRHALEASLFGMLMTLVRRPDATLMLPPCGDRHQLVPRPAEVFAEAQAAKFFRTPWVIESTAVSLAGAEMAEPEINLSTVERPEIRVADLDVHILSHRKREPDVAQRIRCDGPAVLVLDLRDYASLWWSVCDEHKNETLDAAKTATGVMQRWLQEQTGGRAWLHHPELEQKKNKLRQWIAERSHVAAQWRSREKLRRVPRDYGGTPKERETRPVLPAPKCTRPQNSREQDEPKFPSAPSDAGANEPAPVGYTRNVKNAHWLTTHMAADFGLWWDTKNRTYVFLGRPGDTVPGLVEDMLDPNDEWRPVFPADAVNFSSARQMLRQSLAPYGLRPSEASKPDDAGGTA